MRFQVVVPIRYGYFKDLVADNQPFGYYLNEFIACLRAISDDPLLSLGYVVTTLADRSSLPKGRLTKPYTARFDKLGEFDVFLYEGSALTKKQINLRLIDALLRLASVYGTSMDAILYRVRDLIEQPITLEREINYDKPNQQMRPVCKEAHGRRTHRHLFQANHQRHGIDPTHSVAVDVGINLDDTSGQHHLESGDELVRHPAEHSLSDESDLVNSDETEVIVDDSQLDVDDVVNDVDTNDVEDVETDTKEIDDDVETDTNDEPEPDVKKEEPVVNKPSGLKKRFRTSQKPKPVVKPLNIPVSEPEKVSVDLSPIDDDQITTNPLLKHFT